MHSKKRSIKKNLRSLWDGSTGQHLHSMVDLIIFHLQKQYMQKITINKLTNQIQKIFHVLQQNQHLELVTIKTIAKSKFQVSF